MVERTFGWLNLQRRLSKDYEALCETTEAWIYISVTGLMLRRLARFFLDHRWTRATAKLALSSTEYGHAASASPPFASMTVGG